MGFAEDMERLKRRMKQLETEYEQWFSGALRQPPWETKKEVEAIIRRYSQAPPQNLAEQSVFQMHQAKYTTYNEMWNRKVRLKEEGRLPGGREERASRAGSRPRPAPSRSSQEGDDYRQVYDKYVAARQQAGQSVKNLSFQKFREALDKQAQQLQGSGYKDIRFGVSSKGGKVSVVARPKK